MRNVRRSRSTVVRHSCKWHRRAATEISDSPDDNSGRALWFVGDDIMPAVSATMTEFPAELRVLGIYLLSSGISTRLYPWFFYNIGSEKKFCVYWELRFTHWLYLRMPLPVHVQCCISAFVNFQCRFTLLALFGLLVLLAMVYACIYVRLSWGLSAFCLLILLFVVCHRHASTAPVVSCITVLDLWDRWCLEHWRIQRGITAR